MRFTLAPFNRRENIRVEAVVISELKFSDVQRHVLGTDLVERTDDPPLEMLQKPSIIWVCTAPTTCRRLAWLAGWR